MIKSIKAILAQDKEKFKVPRKVQDLIPIKNIWPDGIFKVGNKFSKSFRFSDINYLVASREIGREHVPDILGASEQLGQRSYHEDHHQQSQAEQI